MSSLNTEKKTEISDTKSVSSESSGKHEHTHEHTSTVDAKIIKCLKDLSRKQRDKDISSPRRANVFNKVVLNFPRIQKIFSGLRNLFMMADTDGNGSLDYEELQDILNKLGVEASDKEVAEIFQEADVYTDGTIEFKEFLTCLAVAYVIGIIPQLRKVSRDRATTENKHLGNVDEVSKAFEHAIQMYLTFDRNCRGTISKEDMENVLGNATKDSTKNTKQKEKTESTGGSAQVSGQADSTTTPSAGNPLTGMRWKELDWDQDGYITFQEFMFTFTKWVSSIAGTDDDEEDEEEEEQQENSISFKSEPRKSIVVVQESTQEHHNHYEDDEDDDFVESKKRTEDVDSDEEEVEAKA